MNGWYPKHLAFYQGVKVVTADRDNSWADRWCWWYDRFGNREKARMKLDAEDHFYPNTYYVSEHNIIGWSEIEAEYDKWIPCKERMPEIFGEYLVTWITSASERRFVCFAEYDPAYLYDTDSEWKLEDYTKHYPDVEVIAWQPLPKPYDGKISGDDARELCRSNYAAQMEMLGYKPDGNPKNGGKS